MKFIMINRFNPSVSLSVTPEQGKEHFQNTIKWFDKYQKEGKCLQLYCDAAANILFSIWDVSMEDFVVVCVESPLRKFFSMEYHSILEFTNVQDNLKTFFEGTKED